MNNNRKILTAVSVTVIVTALLTFVATANLFSCNDLPKTNSIISILSDNFYHEVDGNTADEAAARAVADSLGDPYTVYMDADEWESFMTELGDNYCGIGVSVTKESLESYVLVASVFDNSPAAKAGIEPGDYLTAIDNETTKGKTLDEVVSKIKGEEGTFVEITLLKSENSTETNVTVARESIELETVTSEMLDGNIGYIALSSFNENASVHFAEHLNKLKQSGASSFIIDLRNNGGGITTEAEAIASEFLPKGSVIYSTKNKAGKTDVIKVKTDGDIETPIAVLVNENSASASEILAAAIKENNRGVLVGEKTFGKGLVQTVYNFYDGSALKVTIEQYFTAGGNDINKLGITPDYEVELKSEADEQLMYAMDLLKQ